jgi:hypothetical protein
MRLGDAPEPQDDTQQEAQEAPETQQQPAAEPAAPDNAKVEQMFALLTPLDLPALKELIEAEGNALLAQRNEAFDTPLHVAAQVNENEQ